MSDAPLPPDPDPAAPVAAEPASPEDDPESPGGDGTAENISAEDARKLRSEAKNLRDRLKDAESKLSEKERSELDDKGKLERDVSERDTRITAQEAELRTLRVQVAAQKVGIVDPDAAARLLDWDKVEDPDDPKALEKALKELVKERSWLKGDGSGGLGDDLGGRRRGSTGNDMDAMIRRGAGRA